MWTRAPRRQPAWGAGERPGTRSARTRPECLQRVSLHHVSAEPDIPCMALCAHVRTLLRPSRRAHPVVTCPSVAGRIGSMTIDERLSKGIEAPAERTVE